MPPIPNEAHTGELLTVEEAAQRVRLSVSTLNKWRVSGEGPVFVKLGRRVLYRAPDLEAWLQHGRRLSTSEVGQ